MAPGRSLTVALALLLATSFGSAGAIGRKLLEEDGPDPCWLGVLSQQLPEVSSILQVIQAFNLLPDGLPPDATVFLPNNNATKELPAALELPFTLDTVITAANALGPQLKQKLVSLVAYHVGPESALGARELAEQRDIFTALNGTALLATKSSTGGMLLTDTSGRQAHVVDGPEPSTLRECGTAVYVLDGVLMPAASLVELPRTTVTAAQAALGVEGATPQPAP